jgi:hypothetical protein
LHGAGVPSFAALLRRAFIERSIKGKRFMTSMLTRDAILAKNDIVIELCQVPEWGGHVFVKTMTARQKEQWEQERLRNRGADEEVNMTNIRASLVAQTCCDETGNVLFSLVDIDALNDKSIKAMDRVFEAAVKLNRISSKDVDDLTKNSEGTPGESSPSA